MTAADDMARLQAVLAERGVPAAVLSEIAPLMNSAVVLALVEAIPAPPRLLEGGTGPGVLDGRDFRRLP